MVTANLDWATGPKADKPHLEHLCSLGGERSVIFAQEAKNLRLAGLLRNVAGEHVRQDTRNAAVAGTALLSHGVKLHGWALWLAGDSHSTLPRWIQKGTLREWGTPVECMSVHVFPHRVGRATQQRYVDKAYLHTQHAEKAGHAWIVGTDANMALTDFAHKLGGVAHGHGIVGFVVSRNVLVSGEGVDRFGLRHGATDHPAVWIDVEGVR